MSSTLIIKEILQKIGVTILVDFFKVKFKTLSVTELPFLRQRNYKLSLEKSIKDMPFIYKDIDSDVLNDFVDIEIEKLKSKGVVLNNNPSTIKEEQSNKLAFLNSNVLKNYTKILLLGAPGIGKSTLMRHITLKSLHQKNSSYIPTEVKLLPIFIPLKAIENNEKSPIIKYLLNEVEYFKGKKGLKTLEQLAKKTKLFMILDGFDEISYSQNQKFIQHEINLILSDNFFVGHNDFKMIDKTYLELYKNISRCQVWLSSREEFYRINPLGVTEINTSDINLNHYRHLAIVKIKGLGDKRSEFIKNIFNRYKNKGNIFQERLNVEFFIAQISNSPDLELNELSKIPLFLTILCYLYAEDVKTSTFSEQNWTLNIDALIERCIEVLLEDIDSYKVRNLPAIQGKAFMMRRSDYKKEKIIFLQYLSYSLYLDNRSVFDEKYLNDIVEDFVEINPQFYDIFKTVSKNDRINPDIVKQLLYSGVFTNVGMVSNEMKFDFPHRRFRELLAVNYIDNTDKLKKLLISAQQGNIFELVILIFSTRKEYRSILLENLISLTANHEFHEQSNRLILELKASAEFDKMFENILLKFIKDEIPFHLNNSLIKSYVFTEVFYSALELLISTVDNLYTLTSINLILGKHSAILIDSELQVYINKCGENTSPFNFINLYSKIINSASRNSDSVFAIKNEEDPVKTITKLKLKIGNNDHKFTNNERSIILTSKELLRIINKNILLKNILTPSYINILKDNDFIYLILQNIIIDEIGFEKVWSFIRNRNFRYLLFNPNLDLLLKNLNIETNYLFDKIICDSFNLKENILAELNNTELIITKFLFLVNYSNALKELNRFDIFLNYAFANKEINPSIDYSKLKKVITYTYVLNPSTITSLKRRVLFIEFIEKNDLIDFEILRSYGIDYENKKAARI